MKEEMGIGNIWEVNCSYFYLQSPKPETGIGRLCLPGPSPLFTGSRKPAMTCNRVKASPPGIYKDQAPTLGGEGAA